MVERAVLKRVPRDSSETKHMTVIRSGRVLVNGESDSFPPTARTGRTRRFSKRRHVRDTEDDTKLNEPSPGSVAFAD